MYLISTLSDICTAANTYEVKHVYNKKGGKKKKRTVGMMDVVVKNQH